VLALSGLGLGAPPAWAQDSRWTCAAQDKAPVHGDLCGRFIGAGTGFDIRYTHMSGSAIQARFGLYDVATRSFRFDDGPFAMAGAGTRSFAWNATQPGPRVVGFVDVDWRRRFCVMDVRKGTNGIGQIRRRRRAEPLHCGEHPSRDAHLRKYQPGCLSVELQEAWNYPEPENAPAGLTDPHTR
jgi:hypothetical protein